MRPGRQFAYSLCQIGLADRADVTKILGDNYVRVDCLQFWQIHEIKTPACGCLPSDSLIDFLDRKSTRLNSSHANISYAVFCLKKKKIVTNQHVLHGSSVMKMWRGMSIVASRTCARDH